MKNNKTAFLTDIQTIEIKGTTIPPIKADEVLVKMEYCGLCGSDVEFFSYGCVGTTKATFPFVLGHEVSGTIEKVGDSVSNVKVGQVLKDLSFNQEKQSQSKMQQQRYCNHQYFCDRTDCNVKALC